MKRTFLFLMLAVVTMLFSSCASLISQSNIVRCRDTRSVLVTDVMADLEVSPNKVSYLYIPSRAVNRVGSKNVLETAVREALIANGNADVMVQLDKQIKVNTRGRITAITISGYPAKYVKFRSLDDKYLLELAKIYEDLNLKLHEKIAPEVSVPDLLVNILPREYQRDAKDIQAHFQKPSRRKRR